METELFGPVLTVYVYKDDHYTETLHLCNNTSMYGLTGALFCLERKALEQGMSVLRHSAGNFYINDRRCVVKVLPVGVRGP